MAEKAKKVNLNLAAVLKSLPHKLKEVIHPSNVTWKSPRATTKDTGIVLGVVVVVGALLAASDVLFGFLFSILM